MNEYKGGFIRHNNQMRHRGTSSFSGGGKKASLTQSDSESPPANDVMVHLSVGWARQGGGVAMGGGSLSLTIQSSISPPFNSRL